tara:strand:- start:309 stop:632 length:324 start_codon:yes stop_codon:yes gene_type:complete
MMTDDKFYEELSNLINGAFDDAFGRKTENKELPNTKVTHTNPLDIGETTMQSETIKPDPNRDHFPNLYESIEDYTAQTGKRFRMTKNQKTRELTREDAFKEMYGGTN